MKKNRKTKIVGIVIAMLVIGGLSFGSSPVAPTSLLYNNGDVSTGNRAESGESVCCGVALWSELQHDTGNLAEANSRKGFDGRAGRSRLADDFTVPFGQMWTLASLDLFFFDFPGNGQIPVLGHTLQIWSGRPGDPDSRIIFGDTTTNRLVGCARTYTSRIGNTVVPPPGEPTAQGYFGPIWKCTVAIAPELLLSPGTYWLDWDTTHFFDDFVFEKGHPAVTVLGKRGLPDWNARQLYVASGQWTDVIDPGNPLTGPDVPQDFPFKIYGTEVATPVMISGRVTAPDGRGLANTVVSMTDSFGVRRTATTSSFGYYTFDNVRIGETYLIGVNSRRYRFRPRQLQIDGNLTDIDFVGQE